MIEEKARKLTLNIIEIILEEQNGYTKEEIKQDKLAEDCEGSAMFTRIEELLMAK